MSHIISANIKKIFCNLLKNKLNSEWHYLTTKLTYPAQIDILIIKNLEPKKPSSTISIFLLHNNETTTQNICQKCYSRVICSNKK